MKNFILCCFVFLLPSVLIAQSHPGFSKLYRYSADTFLRADGISALSFMPDSQKVYFCLSGLAYATTPRWTSILYKTDIDGNVLNEVMDSITNGAVTYYTVTPSGDSQYLYWGGTSYLNIDSTPGQWRLCKTDMDLNIIWRKDFVLNTRDGSIVAIKTIAGSEDIMLLGSKYTGADDNAGYPEAPNRIHLTRVDSAGNIVTEYTPGPSYYNSGNDMAVSDDGNYLIAGRTFSWGQSNGSAYALKTDGNMDEDWHEIYGQNTHTCWPLGMTKTNDDVESYLITGQSEVVQGTPGKGFVNKIDANGNLLWQRNFAINSDWAHCFWDITNGGINGYVAAGITRNGNVSPSPRGWLLKMDKEGNEKWNKILTANPREGDHEYLYNIVSLPDGGFISAGSTWGQDSYGRWTQEGWLVRVDSNGCMDPACLNGGVGIKDKSKTTTSISIYPNPTNGTVYLSAQTPFATGTAVRLLNNMGSTIKELPAPKGSKMQYDLGGVAAGIYYLEIADANSREVKKVTVVR